MTNDEKAKKPKLLITWGGGYLFQEVISPLMPVLARDFSIVVMMVDFFQRPAYSKNSALGG